jgi:ubiquinone/menaquinone biosynthesis C-methylase UbiE
MNFGYAPTDSGALALKLDAEDERNRQSIELYHRVAGAVDLRGREVVEVGSGRGGGSAFVLKYFQPRSMTGVDFVGKAVAFCKRRHGLKGPSFIHGDAENLPLAAESCDAVVNVESCHCYSSVDRFLQQVARVLRPGGYLLLADVGPKASVDALREQLGQCGLAMVEEENITPNVHRALELNSETNRAWIEEKVPARLRSIACNFAGIKDTPVFEAIRTGEWKYLRFVLQKPRSEDKWTPAC